MTKMDKDIDLQDYKAEEIEKLASQILRHKHIYYKGKPEISDADYDALEDKLKKLSPHHPVLSMVGNLVKTEAKKIEHKRPMLSLDKTYKVSNLL